MMLALAAEARDDPQAIAQREHAEYLASLIEKQNRTIAELTQENKQLKEDIRVLRELTKEAMDKLKKSMADMKAMFEETLETYKNEILFDRRRICKLEDVPLKPSEKRAQQLKKLDRRLVSQKNVSMSFSEIGKFLELGSRSHDGEHSTRRQRMTQLGKILASKPECYKITSAETQNGKMVRLNNDYYLRLLREVRKV